MRSKMNSRQTRGVYSRKTGSSSHPLRNKVMSALHVAHPGVVQMIGLAKSYMWWLVIDKEIED